MFIISPGKNRRFKRRDQLFCGLISFLRSNLERLAQLPALPQQLPGTLQDAFRAGTAGIGLAVFVIIVLLIATITLSLFLRQQPQSGEGLSLEDGAASSLCVASRHT